MFAYCNNNPILLVDSDGTRTVVGASLEKETSEERAISCAYMSQLAKTSNRGYASEKDLTSTQMQKNAKIIYSHLKAKGWSKNAICAVLGNAQHESRINPGRHQVGGPAYGIVQWDPASKYLDWAEKHGYADDSLTGQVEYLLYSMQPGKGEWLSNRSIVGYYLPYSEFITSNNTVSYLTMVFCYSYERPSVVSMELRVKYANYWFDYFR